MTDNFSVVAIDTDPVRRAGAASISETFRDAFKGKGREKAKWLLAMLMNQSWPARKADKP